MPDAQFVNPQYEMPEHHDFRIQQQCVIVSQYQQTLHRVHILGMKLELLYKQPTNINFQRWSHLQCEVSLNS